MIKKYIIDIYTKHVLSRNFHQSLTDNGILT